MKYPIIDKTKLDSINKKRFDALKDEIISSIAFDNNENELGLSSKDIELLAWNVATRIIIKPY
jgi:hypothetical protein